MNSLKWGQAVSAPLLAAFASLSAANPAIAQSGEQGSGEANEIVVIAPRSITAELDEAAEKRQEKAVISLKMTARYGDLDLSKSENVDRLMVRIHSVARDACKYLDRLYPLDVDPECETRAVAEAKPQAEKAIAAAASLPAAT